MNTTYKVPPMLAQVIVLCHESLKACRTYARDVARDVDAHPKMQKCFVQLAADLSIIEGKWLKDRIPSSLYDLYKRDVLDTDELQLDNIKQLFIRMDAQKRNMLEQAAIGILKNEFTVEPLNEIV